MECYNRLKTFLKNKTPGSDGLVAEFYVASWPFFGKHLVITLLKTKGKEGLYKMGDQYLSLLSKQKLPPRQWPNVRTDLIH